MKRHGCHGNSNNVPICGFDVPICSYIDNINLVENEATLNQYIFCAKLETTARERHIVSERGVHASRVSVRYYNIPRWIYHGSRGIAKS